MRFIKTTDWHPGAVSLTERLHTELNTGKSVLWLVSGGSNISVSVAVMQALPEESTRKLTIMLSDERYGPATHADSNGNQLLWAGFAPKRASFVPVLVPGLSLEETRVHYENTIKRAFNEAEIVIGQFGIGSDGHIAGILPGSPATSTADFVASYPSATYQRLTLTSHALKRLNVAYAFVFGADKRDALQELYSEQLSYDEQPSQILKELPEAYVYNDHIEESE